MGFTTGLILPYLERVFCGPAYFITRADKLLRVRMIYYACGIFITRATVRLRFPFTDDLMLFKKIVLMFQKVN